MGNGGAGERHLRNSEVDRQIAFGKCCHILVAVGRSSMIPHLAAVHHASVFDHQRLMSRLVVCMKRTMPEAVEYATCRRQRHQDDHH